ncbi:MAG TPA: SDR family NAD(P)-dependent oxidoreductase [Ruminiclostridium sp.]
MNIAITGANRGLGYELTKKCVDLGHNVVACFRQKSDNADLQLLQENCSDNLLLVNMDVTQEKEVVQAAQAIKEKLGYLDAVISNAGILCDGDRVNDLLSIDIDELRQSIEVNVIGPAMVIKYFYPLLKKNINSIFLTVTSEGGSIKNVGSGYPAYSISKSAENKLVAILDKTISNVRVYAMHPGRVNTEMGRTTAQIEPPESADGIYKIIMGETKIDNDVWFIDYNGKTMDI